MTLPNYILLVSIALQALVSAQVLDFNERVIVGYWHNWENTNAPFIPLDEVNEKYNVVNISFIETPGSGEDGYGYLPVFEPLRTRYPTDQLFIDEVNALKNKGVKVLISIGGQNGHIELNSVDERDTYAQGVIDIVEKYGFDGIDIDYEGSSMTAFFDPHKTGLELNQLTNNRLIYGIEAIQTIHQHFLDKGQDLIITSAPEIAYVQDGALNSARGQFLPFLHNIRDILDYVHVQLYNFGGGIWLPDGTYSRRDPDLLMHLTEVLITGFPLANTHIHFPGLRPDQVALGLPASPNGAGAASGQIGSPGFDPGYYFAPSQVEEVLTYLMDGTPYTGTSYTLKNAHGYPGLRGNMTWSVNWDHSTDSGTKVDEFAEYNYNFFAARAGIGVPKLTVASVSTAEGNSGSSSLAFVLTLSKASETALTVNYTTRDGTALSGQDFLATSGAVTFDAGETQKTVFVTVLGDSVEERDETFSLVLRGESEALHLQHSSVIGTIIDDDTPISISISDSSIKEDEGEQLEFRLSLSRAATESMSVSYSTQDDTALAGQDYRQASGTVNFAIGESHATVAVDIIDDTVEETVERFFVNLSNPSANLTISDVQAVGAIGDDDSAPPRFSGQANTNDHTKQVIGYITQYDPWKGSKNGLPSNGFLHQANVDFSKYTIINFSFFGVAGDGSLHSADSGDRQRWMNRGVGRSDPAFRVQPSGSLLFNDVHSTWDYHLLFGDINPVYVLSAEAVEAGFSLDPSDPNTWIWEEKGLRGALPIPLPDPNGAPGLFTLGKRHNVKIMASLGGWSLSQHFPDLDFRTEDGRQKIKVFVQDCKRLIDLGFDGIDVDWEFPGGEGMNFTGSPKDYDTFSYLMEAIRDGIGPDKLLTAAFHSVPNLLNGYDWPRLNKVMDYYNFFGYDLAGGWSNKANHNAPLYSYEKQEIENLSISNAINYLKTTLNVPAGKINMGYPSYGRGVITSDATATLGSPTVQSETNVAPDGPVRTSADLENWPVDSWAGTPFYYAIKSAYEDAGSPWTYHWDDQAKVPYLVSGNKFLSYDDPRSVAHKVDLYKDEDLAGVIVWTVVGDLELGPNDPNYSGKLKVSGHVRADIADTVNNVFSGVSSPSDYTGLRFGVPDELMLTTRLNDIRMNRFWVDITSNTHKLTEGRDLNYSVTLTLSRSLSETFSLLLQTQDSTAEAGQDYTSISETVTFAPGETTKTINVPILNETEEEDTEQFFITLIDKSSDYALLSRELIFVEIIDDDTPNYVTINDITVDEYSVSGSVSAQFEISLSKPATEVITVNYNTQDLTGTSGQDYTTTSGTARFEVGEQKILISVNVTDDLIDEGAESFQVILTGPTGGAVIHDDTGVAVINDNDIGVVGWTSHYQPTPKLVVNPITPTATWQTGFSGRIEITNTGESISSWTLSFDAPDWSFSRSGSNGTWIVDSGRHTVTNPTWNGYVFNSGTTFVLDFTGQGQWQEPQNIVFNGVPVGDSDQILNNLQYTDWLDKNSITDPENPQHLLGFLFGDASVIFSPNKGVNLSIKNVATKDYLLLELTVNPKAEGVEYRLQVSNDLERWQSGLDLMEMTEMVPQPDGMLKVIWKSTRPMKEFRFLRIESRLFNR